MQSFNELALCPELHQALITLNFQTPTPIQEKTIPLALENNDILGCAQTGTGKTLAFSLPLLNKLLLTPDSDALILAPTRELAIQISDQIEQFEKLLGRFKKLKQALLIGGTSMQTQCWALRQGARIIVATPGRLLDHLERKNVQLSKVQVLVLDEADRMLDMGFAPQLREIFSYLPSTRQTLLFTATLLPHIEKLASAIQKNPLRIVIGRVSRPVENIHQSIIETSLVLKNETLKKELNERKGSIIIFTRTKHRTDRLTDYLEHAGHQVTKIHGDRTQGQRSRAISSFRDGRYRILVATDIAARGIDISNIAHVINYDLPQSAEDYVHRIGRTARAGTSGEAISILTPEDKKQWRMISLKLKQNIPQMK